MLGARWIGVLAASLVAAGVAAGSAMAEPREQHAAREAPVWGALERFDSEAEFLHYLRDARRAAKSHGIDWAGADGVQFAQNQLCLDGSPPPCDDDEAIVVTGSRLVRQDFEALAPNAATPSITNVQTWGVDEGDIVKQIGQYLIVLQDARLFVVDTRPNGRPGLELTSRVNVYRDATHDMWYDEMLVTPQRIVVTGYSYRDQSSQITVFTFSDGVIAHEATYAISSNDYYDPENYATRLVNGRLVIYTPLDLTEVYPDRPISWPLIRRWLRDNDREIEYTPGRPLFNAHDIFKPISPTFQPVVHSVSVCDLGAMQAGDELDCETRGFVAGGAREFFVSTTDAFLWTTPGRDEREAFERSCGNDAAAVDDEGVPAAVFRVPLSARPPTALLGRGQPYDQFGLAATDLEFRALLSWNIDTCEEDGAHLRYLHIPLAAFSETPRGVGANAYANAPTPGSMNYETRFTEAYLVYASSKGYDSYPPDANEPPQSSRVVAIPLARPSQASVLEATHSTLRVERAGSDNIVLTGYRTDAGLNFSLLDLRGAPRFASTTLLEGRYESEGRSHAFNSRVDVDGAGLLGLPTVTRTRRAGRWWWYSQSSDVSFVSVDATGGLASMGSLNARADAADPSYECEVSCIDWYGNSRAIFTDGRIFALSGTEIIEGERAGVAIQEIRRANLSAPLEARVASR